MSHGAEPVAERATLTEEMLSDIAHWVAKFPADQKQSALLPALLAVQKRHDGWLSQGLIRAVAAELDMADIAAFEVATFYSMYELEPVGRHVLEVCTNLSCMLCGSDDLVAHLKERLKIGFGETTADGRFTLKEVECLGACVKAPAMMVGERYYESVTADTIDAILDELE